MNLSMVRCRSAAILWSAALMASTLATRAYAAEPNRVYDTQCALCHQKAGVGLTGQFPRLAGRSGEIAATPAGRRYLIEVMLFGIAGTIEVDGTTIVGVMPGLATLSDEDLASVLNYIISLDAPPTRAGNSKASERKSPPIEAADVNSVRGGPQLSPTQVRGNRELALAARRK